MMTAAEVRARLASVPGLQLEDGEAPLVVHAPTADWRALANTVRHELGFGFFSFLTAIDWKDDGLEVVAWVDHPEARLSMQLRTKLGAGVLSCPSLVDVYRGANWMERECFDMFGVVFEGHPDLRRILLPDDWVGHPLLKSYDVDTPYPPYR